MIKFDDFHCVNQFKKNTMYVTTVHPIEKRCSAREFPLKKDYILEVARFRLIRYSRCRTTIYTGFFATFLPKSSLSCETREKCFLAKNCAEV